MAAGGFPMLQWMAPHIYANRQYQLDWIHWREREDAGVGVYEDLDRRSGGDICS